MSYEKVDWDENTPINPANLDTMDQGIKDVEDEFHSHEGSGGMAHATATTMINGFMEHLDKSKLNGIDWGANDYELEVHDNDHHNPNLVIGNYEIQKDGTDGAGIINFKTM